MYSDNDKTIHPENTMKIIKNFNPNTRFEKLLIEEGHNSIRCKETLRNIF